MSDPTIYQCDFGGDETRCPREVDVVVWTAYDTEPGTANNPHPGMRRYPAPMRRTCWLHLPDVLFSDALAPGSTRQWMVETRGRNAQR